VPDHRLLSLLLAPAGLGTVIWLGDVAAAAVIAAAMAAAHLMTIPNRSGRQLSLTAMVSVASLLVTDGAVVDLLGGAAVGMPIGWLIVRARSGSRGLDHLFPSDPISLIAAVLAYQAGGALLRWPGNGYELTDFGRAAVVGGAAVAWYLAAVVVRSAGPTGERATAGSLRREALRDGSAYATLFAGGALFGLGWPAMGWWAVPLAALPYGFSHLSLHRVAVTRRTYRQTIRALGRMPEATGQTSHGRAQRTAGLAVATAAELGFGHDEVEMVEFAGLLHDVGRVVFSAPAVAAGGYSDADVAAWGAAIIREAPALAPVATVVAEQEEAYRQPGAARRSSRPAASQVIRVAAAYDRSVTDGALSPSDALEALHRGTAYDYDPEVVAAMRRVLQRRGVRGA
jgi:hypothetical protein